MQFLKAMLDVFCEITALISAFQRYVDTLREMNDKMKIDGFKCDTCTIVYYPSPMHVGTLPEGWFTLTKGSSGLVQQDKHFHCIECLIEWTSLQTVDIRKVDTGGPVVALSGEEYKRRFGKQEKPK